MDLTMPPRRSLFWCVLLSLTLGLTFTSIAQAGEPGKEGEEQEERHVHKRILRGAPHGEIKGLHPHFRWSGLGGGFLGVGLSDLTPELLSHFGVDAEGGAMINRVSEDSPAAAAGLKAGDIITRAGETQVLGPSQLARTVRQLEDGALVEIEYWRDGRLETTTATVEARESAHLKVIDLGDMNFEGLGDLEALEGLGPEIMEQVQESLERVFDEDWQKSWEVHVEKLKEINVEQLEGRMEELRERMQELEERLEERYGEGESPAKNL